MTKGQKIIKFLKENLYLVVLGISAIIFAVLIIIASSTATTSKVNDNKTPVSVITTYYTPVLDATICKEFSATELQFNKTLNQWEAHKSIDFLASAGAEVRSITSGEVVDVFSNYLQGNVVKIQHANGLVSEYGSLSDDVKVKKGDKVSANAIIGYVSDSAANEAEDGNHLHFTMYNDNGKKIDPAGYLNISSK